MSSDRDTIDSRHATFELKTLLDTSRLLIESHNLDFVLSNVLLIAMGKLITPKAAILLWKPHQKKYQVARVKGKVSLTENHILPIKNVDQLIAQNRITVTDNEKLLPDIFSKNGFSMLFNIKTSNEHLGYLCIGYKANNQPYAQHELDFIENLVNVSSVAISNSLLVAQLRDTNLKLDKKVQELHTLFDISKEFNATVDREPIIKIFKFALLGQMFIRSFFFASYNKQGKPYIITQTGIKGTISEKDLDIIFSFKDTVTRVTDSIHQLLPVLAENNIVAIVRLILQDDEAYLAVGMRATNEEYTEADFNFLVSLTNLALLSIQKTAFLQERIEKERLEEELSIARTIQEKLLPNPLPEVPFLDVAAMNVPSRQVGGDYYDVICRDGQVYFAIADVTGKGIPAALLMANVQAILHVLTPVQEGLAEITAKINDMIYKNTPSDKFISFFWCMFSNEFDEFRYVNAGHNPPYLFSRRFNEPVLLSEGGMLLGALPTIMPYSEGIQKLEKDDVIVMYTDGVTEALSETEDEYGDQMLIECIRKNTELDANGILQAIVDDVKEFTRNRYNDDITIIVIKKT